MFNILDLLFPKKCINCSKTSSYLCPNCISQISQSELICPFCNRTALGGKTHPVCQSSYGLDGLWSLGLYKNPIRKAIQKLKYRWITELAEVLVNIIIEYWIRYQPYFLDEIKKDEGQNWLVVPIPLHKSRENWRGFNQSALLAKQIAKKLNLKYSNCLIRTRQTKPQVSLSGDERRQNLKNAFSLNTKYLIRNTKVLLIDDVWTTGSTIKECCNILKREGAQKVWAITLAR